MRDPSDQFGQLKSVLTFQDKLRKRLNNVRCDLLAKVLSDDPGPEARRVASGELHPQESLIILTAFECARPTIEPLLIEEVVVKLDRPPIVTADDLVECFLDHLIVPDGEYEAAFGRFVRGVIARVRMVGSRPMSIAISPQKLADGNMNKTLWRNTVASVALVGSGPAGAEQGLGTSDPTDKSVVVYARANVFGSPYAAACLQEEMGPLLRL